MTELELEDINELEVLVRGLKEIEDEIRGVRQYHEARLRLRKAKRMKEAIGTREAEV